MQAAAKRHDARGACAGLVDQIGRLLADRLRNRLDVIELDDSEGNVVLIRAVKFVQCRKQMLGDFREDARTRAEFMQLIRGGRSG